MLEFNQCQTSSDQVNISLFVRRSLTEVFLEFGENFILADLFLTKYLSTRIVSKFPQKIKCRVNLEILRANFVMTSRITKDRALKVEECNARNNQESMLTSYIRVGSMNLYESETSITNRF